MENSSKLYQLTDEDKVTPVMVYTDTTLLTGEVVTKNLIRVSTWPRTPMMPQYITLYSALLIDMAPMGGARQMQFQELYVPFSNAIAFHIRPPASDPLDYDPNEPMRKMEPVTALVGPFQFDGSIRMSSQTNLIKYLDVNKEIFTSLYDIEITPLGTGAMKPFHVPYALLRRDEILFSIRHAG